MCSGLSTKDNGFVISFNRYENLISLLQKEVLDVFDKFSQQLLHSIRTVTEHLMTNPFDVSTHHCLHSCVLSLQVSQHCSRIGLKRRQPPRQQQQQQQQAM